MFSLLYFMEFNDFASLNLPGRLKTPAGKSEPFTVQLLDA